MSYKDMFALNSIGFALVMMALQARLKYLVTEAYHREQYIKDQIYPVVQLVNRVSHWGILFVLSVFVLIIGCFKASRQIATPLLNFAFLMTSCAYIVFLMAYIKYLIGNRFRDLAIYNWWINGGFE